MTAPYLHLVADTSPPSFGDLIAVAHAAAQEARDALHDPNWSPDMPEAAQLAYEARTDEMDQRAADAKQAVLDWLLGHGVTTAGAVKLAEVLT